MAHLKKYLKFIYGFNFQQSLKSPKTLLNLKISIAFFYLQLELQSNPGRHQLLKLWQSY